MQDGAPRDAADAARTARDALAAQKAQIELRKIRGELVDRAAAVAHVTALAGEMRDAVMALPGERASAIAGALGVDPSEVERVLRDEFGPVLERLSGVRVDLSA